jgi:glutamine amidotransferase
VVPGVDAFATCMDGLKAVGGPGYRAPDRRWSTGTAICVSHQVLFAEGIEHGRRADGRGSGPVWWRSCAERLRT